MQLMNRTKVIQVLNIPCRAGCDGADCLCQNVTTTLNVTDKDGTKGKKVLERRLAGSITILAGQKLEVPDWVAESAPVKDAVAKNVLRLVKA